MIDGDPRRERIPVAGDPAGQRQAASAGFFGVRFPNRRVAFGWLRESGVGFGDLLLCGADLLLVGSGGLELEMGPENVFTRLEDAGLTFGLARRLGQDFRLR